jgi:hypothetical protein
MQGDSEKNIGSSNQRVEGTASPRHAGCGAAVAPGLAAPHRNVRRKMISKTMNKCGCTIFLLAAIALTGCVLTFGRQSGNASCGSPPSALRPSAGPPAALNDHCQDGAAGDRRNGRAARNGFQVEGEARREDN